jgi:predicted hydrolase (HD superfamily)
LNRDAAWKLFSEWTETPSLQKHGRAVEIVMRRAAHKYGRGADDEERWGIAGLLHDADYEKWPEDHPHRTVNWLKDQGEHEIAHAISAHYTKWNVPYESQLDRALLACDELTGFIVACCLVRPEGIRTLESSSVKKKLKDKAFAAKVEREEVHAGVKHLAVELDEHIRFIIDALKPHAEELGIQGKAGGS